MSPTVPAHFAARNRSAHLVATDMTTTHSIAQDSVAQHHELAGLRVLTNEMTIDVEAAERAVRDLLLALGRDPEAEQMAETPDGRRGVSSSS
jgi:hypothetical protein